ncbi:hypothetical protein WN55_00456 [Dufourea novaeangliae]|uniref:Uncharacterized protein n=1 Tax=Dufourea novaeangliae TaxID=178035 RepID=A0A154PF06_DUFNO|nr:hypothetical protein WN55_00456 [Dufourea novaeangliae]
MVTFFFYRAPFSSVPHGAMPEVNWTSVIQREEALNARNGSINRYGGVQSLRVF